MAVHLAGDFPLVIKTKDLYNYIWHIEVYGDYDNLQQFISTLG